MRLDLHVHGREAANFAEPDASITETILNIAKRRGLEGIAITDHDGMGTGFAFKLKEMISHHFHNGLMVIPGLEKSCGPFHVVEVYLSENCTFRFIAHPGISYLPLLEKDYPQLLKTVQGIEIENGNYWVDIEGVTQFALKHGLMTLSNSDAHSLLDIGRHYNDLDVDELVSRVKNGSKG